MRREEAEKIEALLLWERVKMLPAPPIMQRKEKTMKKFFVVIRDQEGTFIKHRHATVLEAAREAQRLCRKERKRFYVAEVVAAVEFSEAPVIWTDLSDVRQEEARD
jgi:hypothetical protein